MNTTASKPQSMHRIVIAAAIAVVMGAALFAWKYQRAQPVSATPGAAADQAPAPPVASEASPPVAPSTETGSPARWSASVQAEQPLASGAPEGATSERPIIVAAADPVQRPAAEATPSAAAATPSLADADSAIGPAVRAQLAGDSALRDVQINVADGIVKLGGMAPDQAAIEHARELAAGVPNVLWVDTTALTVAGNSANGAETGAADGAGNGAAITP